MSKAQFVTGLRRCFGDELLKSESAASKLFDSFDFEMRDQMDWRTFLFLLLILMQPWMSYEEHLQWGYALYVSNGTLDLECRDKIPLTKMKEMMCAPLVLTFRPEVRYKVINFIASYFFIQNIVYY